MRLLVLLVACTTGGPKDTAPTTPTPTGDGDTSADDSAAFAARALL